MADERRDNWHRQKGVPFALHTAGGFLMACGWLLARYLTHLMPPGVQRPVTPVTLLVGGAMVASASIGTAFLILGPRLFDKVRVSQRWARLSGGREG